MEKQQSILDNSLPLVFVSDAVFMPGSITNIDLPLSDYKNILQYETDQGLFFLCGFFSSFDKSKVLPCGVKVFVVDIAYLDNSNISVLIEGIEAVDVNFLSQSSCSPKSSGSILSIVDYSEIKPWADLPENCNIDLLKQDVYGTSSFDADASYPDLKYKGDNLVILRWLEIIPIPNELKFDFLKEVDARNVVLLITIMISNVSV